MNQNSENNLEQFVHRTLRSLPERHAPSNLEHRVMAAIAARQSLPWYHQSFAHWPDAVKVAFLGVSALIVVGIILVGQAGTGAATDYFHNASSLLRSLRIAADAVGSSGQSLFKSIPDLWLYGSLALIGTLYAALFGLGTAAYKTIISNR